MNTSPSSIDDPSVLKKPLCTPMLKKIDLHFPLGMEVTARNLKGVTIKDALDAIHKQYKKRVRHYCRSVTRLVQISDLYCRRMTKSTSHTLQASNGTRRPTTRSSSCTRRRLVKRLRASLRRRTRAAMTTRPDYVEDTYVGSH